MLFAHGGAPLFPQRSMISSRGERRARVVVIDTFTIAGRFSSLPRKHDLARFHRWPAQMLAARGSIYMQIPTIKRRDEGVDGAFVRSRKWVIRTIVGTRYRDGFAEGRV